MLNQQQMQLKIIIKKVQSFLLTIYTSYKYLMQIRQGIKVPSSTHTLVSSLFCLAACCSIILNSVRIVLSIGSFASSSLKPERRLRLTARRDNTKPKLTQTHIHIHIHTCFALHLFTIKSEKMLSKNFLSSLFCNCLILLSLPASE